VDVSYHVGACDTRATRSTCHTSPHTTPRHAPLRPLALDVSLRYTSLPNLWTHTHTWCGYGCGCSCDNEHNRVRGRRREQEQEREGGCVGVGMWVCVCVCGWVGGWVSGWVEVDIPVFHSLRCVPLYNMGGNCVCCFP
jgi:hypothetical protein